MNEKEINYSLKKYMEEIVQNDLDKFDAFIRWGDSEREEFKVLLENFKKPYDKRIETTKSKGDRLENLVEFIIKKSYFFEIYKTPSAWLFLLFGMSFYCTIYKFYH